MKKITFLLFSFLAMAFMWQGNAQTFTGTPTNVPLGPNPASPPGVSVADVTATGVVGDDLGEFILDDVTLSLTHTWGSDLEIRLTSPSGTVLMLSDNRGGSDGLFANPTEVIFDDNAPTSAVSWPNAPNSNYTFSPEGGLFNTVFAGQSINGDWTITINDLVGGDGGTLFSYSISFTENTVIGDPPQIVCPNDIVINNETGTCGAQVFFNNATAIDPEDGLIPVAQTMGPGTGSIFPIGDTIIEFSATDSDGNTSTCQFTITVEDVDDPIALCQDATVELDETGTVVLNAEELNFGFGFSCTYSIGLYDTFGDGWNSAGSAASVDVIVDGDVVLDNATLNGGSGPEWFDFEVMPGQSIEVVYTTNGTWAAENWFEVVDGPGGSGDVIYDTPVGSVPPANNTVTNSCESGVGSSDGCGPVTFSFDEDGLVTSLVLDCSNLGDNTITLYVTDEGGNVVSCESIVTVEDNIAPVIVCASEAGSVSDTVSDSPALNIVDNQTVSTTINVTESELITDLDLVLNINHTWVGDLAITLESPNGTSVVVFDGAQDGCSANDIMVTFDDESANALACTAGTASSAFPLDDYIPSNALSAFDGEDTAGVWTLSISDSAGGDQGILNSWGLTYTYDVPAGNIPQYFLDADGQVSVPITDLYTSVSDNAGACGITVTVGTEGVQSCVQSTPSNAFENGHGNLHILTVANDFSVEAGSTFTVDEFNFNLIHQTGILPTGVTLTFYEDSGNGPGALISTETNIAPSSIVEVGSNFGFPFSRVTLPIPSLEFTGGTSGSVYWVGVRLEGYSGTQSFWEGTSIVETDNQGYIDLDAGAGFEPISVVFASAPFDGVFEISGTCGGAGGANFIFTCADLGVINVTVTATDASGNSTSCVTQVEIIDDIAPVLVTQDITVELDENGEASIVYQDLYASSPDDYEVIAIGSNGLVGAGDTDLTVPVTDAATISFDWDYSTTDGPGWDSFGYLLNGTYTQLTNDAITNQSGNATVGVNPGDVFGFRVMTDDNFGGAGQALISEFMPGFQGQFAPANWTETLTNSNGSATFITIPGGVLAYDNCGIDTGAVDISNFTCADIGTPVTVTVFVSDASGNIASSTAVVTVVDLLGPVFDCPDDMTVDTDPDSVTYTLPDYIGDGLVSVTDNCTEPVTIFSQSPAPGTLLLDGTYTITLTAEDEYGNESTCSFELTVDTVLGTDENELGNAIAMYPNPANSYVDLRNSSNIALTQATIYDITGKLVSSFDLTQMVGEQRLDVSNLASGVYMVYINSETASVVKRLIKK